MAVAASRELISMEAGADLSAAACQYCIVKMTDENEVVLATAGTDIAIGVLQNRPKEGEGASICVGGRSKYRASAGTAEGLQITATTGGEGVATTTPGNFVIGYSLTTVANADEYGDILVVHSRVPA